MGEFKANADAQRPSIIVVGAGAGGVATAARLAAAGCKVTVVEKNDFSGGRCSLIQRQQYVGNALHAYVTTALTVAAIRSGPEPASSSSTFSRDVPGSGHYAGG